MTRIGCKMANSYRCDIYMCSDYIRSVCNTVFKNEKSVLLKVSSLLQVFVYLKYIQCAKMWKNVEKRASQVLTYQKMCISRSQLPKNVQNRAKNMQKRAKTCKNVQKRASQMFFDPIQKHALSRSVHLEALYLEALLYLCQLA